MNMLAIVLSRKDFRDYDQIISVYTQEKGKMSLLVRGVKKIVSKNSAYLEPFSIVNITVEKGKEVDYLTRVQSENYLCGIRENLQKSLVATYIVSLVDKLFSEGEVDNKFFSFLQNFLVYLDSLKDLNDKMAVFILDVFAVNLLSFFGFKLSSDEKIINSEFLTYIQVFESAHSPRRARQGGQGLISSSLLQNDPFDTSSSCREVVYKGDLSEIFSLNFEVDLAKKIHKVVYNFLVHYTERKIVDWAKTCVV